MIYSYLRYPGSKRRVLDILIPKFPDGIKDWREPFFGSGSVTIGFLQSPKAKDCNKVIVGDLYTELWAFWSAVQKNPQRVKEVVYYVMANMCPTKTALASMMNDGSEAYKLLQEKAIEEAKALWDWTQKADCEKMSLEERAARFAIVNRISFSAMGDSGSLSKDRYSEFNPIDIEKIDGLSQLLANVEIWNEPFQKTMADTTAESFIFLDPPYARQEDSGLYGRGGSTHKGFPHRELADLCKTLNCPWLMTYDDSVIVRQLYQGCHLVPFQFDYTMAKTASEDALAGEELLISNYYSQESEEASFEDF